MRRHRAHCRDSKIRLGLHNPGHIQPPSSEEPGAGSCSAQWLVLQAHEHALQVEVLTLLPLGKPPWLPGAQLVEGQTAMRDRPVPGWWHLSHSGLKEAWGQTGNNPKEAQKHCLGYIKGPRRA